MNFVVYVIMFIVVVCFCLMFGYILIVLFFGFFVYMGLASFGSN